MGVNSMRREKVVSTMSPDSWLGNDRDEQLVGSVRWA